MSELKCAIGLFGTAGQSRWRDPVMTRLEQEGIPYFNPIVDEWTPECAPLEAENLATDKVLLFVVTGEEESFGSLAETGWAALSGMQNGQTVLFVIQNYPAAPQATPNRARELVRSHARRAGVAIFDTVEEALEAAVVAFRS